MNKKALLTRQLINYILYALLAVLTAVAVYKIVGMLN